MLTLLSSLLSFLMSGLPSFIKVFQDRADKAHEIELAKMQTERGAVPHRLPIRSGSLRTDA